MSSAGEFHLVINFTSDLHPSLLSLLLLLVLLVFLLLLPLLLYFSTAFILFLLLRHPSVMSQKAHTLLPG